MIEVNTDCVYCNGYKPCKFHKLEGIHCNRCRHYTPWDRKILIIKLQAAGEVIRNTPLLRKLTRRWPKAKIFWLTKFPELVPVSDRVTVLDFNLSSTLFLLDESFDVVYSLDKDLEACALANRIEAKLKKGFSQKNGVIIPFDGDAHTKWLTGVFDDLMAANTRHYVEEMFALCGFQWRGERYLLPTYPIPDVDIPAKKKIVGLNIGAGALWKTRKLSVPKWISLAKMLKPRYEIVLLGGPEEDAANRQIAAASGVNYYGTFEYLGFIGLMSRCDLIVTSVTAALHIAIGLRRKIVLLNNIFPANEFHLYGLGEILEPDIPCKKCYKAAFDNACYRPDCLDLIDNNQILRTIDSLL